MYSRAFWYFILWLFVFSQGFYACTTSSVSATDQIRKGDAFHNQQKYVEAIEAYETYLSQSASLGMYRNTDREAAVQRKIAQSAAVMGKYNRAERALRQAIGIDSMSADSKLALISDYRLLGLNFVYQRDYGQAIENLQRAVKLSRGLDRSAKSINQQEYADTHLALAQVYFSLAAYLKARDHIRRAREIYRQINDDRGMMECALWDGTLWYMADELDRAEEQVLQSISLAEKSNNSLSRHFQILADIYGSMGRLDDELSYQLTGLQMAEQSGNVPQMIWMHIKSGDVYRKLGDEKKASAHYQEAYQLQQSTDTTTMNPSLDLRLGNLETAYQGYLAGNAGEGRARARLLQAQAALEEQKFDLAKQLVRESLQLYQMFQLEEEISQCWALLSQCHLNQGSFDSAKFYVAAAQMGSTDPNHRWQYAFLAGEVYYQQGQLDQAIPHYKESVVIIESLRGTLKWGALKSSYFSTKIKVYDRLIDALIKKADLEGAAHRNSLIREAFSYTERARSRHFLDLLGNRALKPQSENDSLLLQQEQLERMAMANRPFHSPNYTEGENYQTILKKLIDQNEAYASILSVEPPSLAEIQDHMVEDEVYLDYWVGESGCYMWTIGKQGLDVYPLNISKTRLTQLVNLVRNFIRIQEREKLDEVLADLYDKLISPASLKITGGKNVVLVPHGPLHFLPFQSLKSSSGRFFIQDHIIHYVPSMSFVALAGLQKTPDIAGILGMALGNLEKDGFAPLPATLEEVQHIAQLYERNEILIAERSTETQFKSRAQNYSMLHIASHGTMNETEPFQSYILLESDGQNDGYLKVGEIFNISLSASCIVLSACETGLGKLDSGDEIIGLTRSLLYAGSPAVVASLWTVDDLSTSLFMIKFHQYLKGGHTIAASLTFAQRDLIEMEFAGTSDRGARSIVWSQVIQAEIDRANRDSKRHPYFWAAFNVIGDGKIKELQ